MKLHEHPSQVLNQITAHASGQVTVSGKTLTAPCMVAPHALVDEWITGIDALDDTALGPLLELGPQLALLGSALPDPVRWRGLRRTLAARGIALETMDLGAACRTYNVLVQEDRSVVALLFP